MPVDLADDKTTLVQVMAWCRQATSHYLSQYWPRSISPYVVTRPQWVKWAAVTWLKRGYQYSSISNRYPGDTHCLLLCIYKQSVYQQMFHSIKLLAMKYFYGIKTAHIVHVRKHDICWGQIILVPGYVSFACQCCMPVYCSFPQDKQITLCIIVTVLVTCIVILFQSLT